MSVRELSTTPPPTMEGSKDLDRSPAPSTSLLSEDSFTTAHTSASPLPASSGSVSASASKTADSSNPSANADQASPTTRRLRKSISADSFNGRLRAERDVNGKENGVQARDEGPAAGPSTESGTGSSSPRIEQRGTLSSPPSTLSFSGYIRSKVGPRKRGASYSTTDNETSTQEDSDIDRERAPKAKGRVRSRLLSFRGSSSRTTGTMSGPEQPPPPSASSRLPVRGTSASLSNLKTSNLPTHDPHEFSSSTTPLAPQPPVLLGQKKRTRSYSLGGSGGGAGAAAAKAAKRFSFGNQTPKPQIERSLSIAVVGAPGCGKSTFIRKGLKRHEVSPSEQHHGEMTVAGNMKRTISFYYRTARLLTEFNTEIHLSVFECSTHQFETEDKSSVFSIWPSALPHIDGIFVCYDASDPSSFKHVVQLLSGCKELHIPSVVLACKSDLENRIESIEAGRTVAPYSRVVEISNVQDDGRKRMRKAVEKHVKDIITSQAERKQETTKSQQKPITTTASPERPTKAPILKVQTGPPISNPPAAASTSAPSLPSSMPQPTRPPIPRSPSYSGSPVSPTSTKRAPSAPSSPSRVRSMNDILSEHHNLTARPYDSDRERIARRSIVKLASGATKSAESLPVTSSSPAGPAPISSTAPVNVESTGQGTEKEKPKNRPPPSPWVTIEDLLEKLFFLAISGDDPAFISHFFLTYRRFATPRSVLLGMQKRMNELRQPSGDITLACYAQMRICNLLEQWMYDYPNDFAVPGTHGALNAFIRQILTHSHTLYYGSDFLPFVERMATLTDEDAAWALEVKDFSTESDTESMLEEEAESESTEPESAALPSPHHQASTVSEPATSPKATARERRSSLPLSAMGLLKTPYLNSGRSQRVEQRRSPSPKEVLSRLQKVAASLTHFEADTIANEITRQELELFLAIKPRDWLRHTLISGKKDPSKDPIAKFNTHYNDLHEWAVSLILCHDRPKARARQIEKFAEVAIRLRSLNNYSGLRAIITAINQATYPGDQPMELFKSKIELHKKFLSSDILLRTTGSHQSYRMALRNTKGPCIPSLEVHTSDLRRANEGNQDTKPGEPSKINWAKFNMIGRFISTPTALQHRCHGPNGYKFFENKLIGQHFDVPVMDYEMQQSRISQPPDEEPHTSPVPPSAAFPGAHTKEKSIIKHILPW